MSTKVESISQDTFSLKGQVSRDFLLLVFFVNHLPLIIIASGSFLEFFRKFAEIFAIQGAQLASTVPLSPKILPTAPHLHVEGSALLHCGDPVAVVESHSVLCRVDVEGVSSGGATPTPPQVAAATPTCPTGRGQGHCHVHCITTLAWSHWSSGEMTNRYN